MRTVSQGAFSQCKNLRKAVLNEGLEVLGTEERLSDKLQSGAFSESAVESVTLPPTLRRIERNAFRGCGNLSDVKLPERLEYLGEMCFAESAVERMRLSPALKRIADFAFCGCKKLVDVRFPEGLETIGKYCFSGSGLEELAFPASVRKVGAYAFCNCHRLKSIALNEGLELLGPSGVAIGRECEGGAFAATAITSVRLPSTLKRLEAGTFRFCKRLAHVEIPSGVEYIGDRCFEQCGIMQITLPGTLKRVGKDLFAYQKYPPLVWVEDGCGADARSSASGYAVILPARQKVVGGQSLFCLRMLRAAALPDGIREVGK